MIERDSADDRTRSRPVTIDELAKVPKERRRLGWVLVRMVRSSGRTGPKTWDPLYAIGFFKTSDDAIAFGGGDKRSGKYRNAAIPIDDGDG